MKVLNPNETHTRVVMKVVKTEKTFKTQDGIKDKWVVYFTDGYTAEVTPLSGFSPVGFVEGKKVTFRIIAQNAYGDTIEAMEGKPLNMQGHPAVTALGIAKDLHIQFKQELDPEAVTQTADILYGWLLEKTG